MDRDHRREIRKRGAATRELATGEIVVKTPKKSRRSWIPVSQDPGAIITEELSSQFSPELRFSQQVSPGYDYSNKTPPSGDQQSHRRQTSKPRSPQTPLERIRNEPVETLTGDSNGSYVSIRTPARLQTHDTQKRSPRSKSRSSRLSDYTAPRSKTRRTQSTRSDSKNKSEVSVIPKAAPRTKKKLKSVTPRILPSTRGKSNSSRPTTPGRKHHKDRLVSKNNLPGPVKFGNLHLKDMQDEEIPNNMKLFRLPTSGNRLTAIDTIRHYLENFLPTDPKLEHFGLFKESVDSYLQKALDLNLTNNTLVSKLKDVKALKSDLRSDLFDIKSDISDNMAKAESLRKKYNVVKSKLILRRKIKDHLKKLKENEGSTGSFDSSKIVEDLNVLNNTLDPYWGLSQKLKTINHKLYTLDERL